MTSQYLIIGDSRSEKTNVFFKLVKNHWPDIGKIYLHVKDPFEPKYQSRVNGKEKAENK